MEQSKCNTKIAGVDVGKHRLDAAVHGLGETMAEGNDAPGISALIARFRALDVGRVGLEATGGYERALRERLEQEGFEVVVHQPIEVRLFAKLKRRRAKNDRLDATLIAAFTAQVDVVRAAQDKRLVDLGERLSAYEQITDQAAEMKSFLESVRLKDVAALVRSQIRALERLKARLLAEVIARIKAQPDLAARLQLLMSLPGIGPVVAATLVVRMPELGAMRRGQPAALLGVAPFDRESGQWKGLRFIAGGRRRPRRMLYLAALAAKRADPGLRAFAEQLRNRGKPPKVAVVAVMRKLVEAANLVLQRGQPWVRQPQT
jgi:transposase